ncbi:DUF983 domain-containing protein [Rhodobacteraceae bacterium RKSG542]|uniref:DUF983 domain-containing protein n=1 Tax=Pseudovibrio flavus TaxID=2529854 RepID=UPI0012BCF636|nr:DUF983 domain-containing protein [Pseudovibrio flavus]MTI16377.1 DUF983 domain-containing protein [Pseudovibrio flavus]
MTGQNTTKTPSDREVAPALLKGSLCKCPACGTGKVFDGYLTVRAQCDACGEELHHHRADDAPPYFTIFIVGHIVVWLMLVVEMAYFPPLWLHIALWVPLTIVMSLAMLRPIKGALVGLQWALKMHGFDPNSREDYPAGSDKVTS